MNTMETNIYFVLQIDYKHNQCGLHFLRCDEASTNCVQNLLSVKEDEVKWCATVATDGCAQINNEIRNKTDVF